MTDVQAVRVVGLRVEHTDGDPLGVGTGRPRLSWRTETELPDWKQVAWEVEALGDGGQEQWCSGRQDGDASVLVAWGGTALLSRSRGTWRVRVWGADGSTSGWSAPARFEIGLVDVGDWQAEMIGATRVEAAVPTGPQPATHLRTTFTLDREVASARLHLTALGVYEATINGNRVGDHVLAPGWTAYRHRLHVQTFDVSASLMPGAMSSR